jgi:hypothetical protein|eukprot:COSAG01_NODE_308_length_19148_cov_13.076697_3_plen_106_part_00
MLSTDGEVRVVPDEDIVRAKEMAEGWGVPVCHTGAAGLAGLLQAQAQAQAQEEEVDSIGAQQQRQQSTAGAVGAAPSVIILSGLDRTMSAEAVAELKVKAASVAQ